MRVGRPWGIVLLAGLAAWLTGPASAQERVPEAGGRYALLVGVRRYDPNELRPLPFSEPDVVDLAKVLLANGYQAENVVLMTQTAGAEDTRFLPTAANIRKELSLLLADRAEGDSVLVAFAGHGVQYRGDGESYFCPADARLEDKATLVSLREIYRALERCPAGLRVLLVDACRNDPRSDNSRARAVVDLESVTRPQAKAPPGGVVALFSCSEGEKAYEHADLKHGVFFHFVIEALGGAAAREGTGEVTVPDLESYAKRRVSDFVRSKYGVRQMPDRVGQERGLVPLVRLNVAEMIFRRGKEYLEKEKYDRAIAELTEAIRLDPKDARAYYERGWAFHKKGNEDRAIADANEALRINPSFSEAHYDIGEAHFAKGDYDKAIGEYGAELRLNPKLEKVYSARGDAYLRKKEYDQAIADFTARIRLGPEYQPAYTMRGRAYIATRDFGRAITDFNEAIRLNPQDPVAYYERGVAFAWKSDWVAAIRDYNEAIRLDPKHALAYQGRGRARAATDPAGAKADKAYAHYLDPKLGND